MDHRSAFSKAAHAVGEFLGNPVFFRVGQPVEEEVAVGGEGALEFAGVKAVFEGLEGRVVRLDGGVELAAEAFNFGLGFALVEEGFAAFGVGERGAAFRSM